MKRFQKFQKAAKVLFRAQKDQNYEKWLLWLSLRQEQLAQIKRLSLAKAGKKVQHRLAKPEKIA